MQNLFFVSGNQPQKRPRFDTAVVGGGGGLTVLNLNVHRIVLNGKQVTNVEGLSSELESLVYVSGNINMNFNFWEERFQDLDIFCDWDTDREQVENLLGISFSINFGGLSLLPLKEVNNNIEIRREINPEIWAGGIFTNSALFRPIWGI